MDSRLGPFLLSWLPSARRRKDASVLSRLLDALGESYDAAKDAIYRLRRRGFIWQLGDGSDAYYGDPQRGLDLNRHALDRGTRRLQGETDEALWQRLAIQPAVRQHAGSAMGMRYLVEDVLGHTLYALTVYADDPEARIVRSEVDQAAQVEAERSHLFSAADQANPDMVGLRQTRLYSQADLDIRFTFWLSILPAGPLDAEERTRVTELVMAEKPAHTACVLTFVEA